MSTPSSFPSSIDNPSAGPALSSLPAFMAAVFQGLETAPHAGIRHVFLGHPLSDAVDKTTVEAGNVFSPGLWTCGISPWVGTSAGLFSPLLWTEGDSATDGAAAQWGFAAETEAAAGEKGEGREAGPGTGAMLPPLLCARWKAGPVTVTSLLGHRGGEGATGRDFLEVRLRLTGAEKTKISFALALREVGPAGGPVRKMMVEAAADGRERSLVLNQDLRVEAETVPLTLALEPLRNVSTDAGAEPARARKALFAYEADLGPGEELVLRFSTRHGFGERPFGRQLEPVENALEAVEEKGPAGAGEAQGGGGEWAPFTALRKDWEKALPARLFAPDPRIAAAWEASAFHILSAMECGLPRIGAVTYPVFWIRDCIIVLRALDLFGRSDLARTGCDYLAPLHFGGGFGAESDAPGEGLWALWNHARMTVDREWLRGVWHDVEARIAWLDRMRTATKILRRPTENRIPFYQDAPGVNVVCLPAKDGLIQGRMDWHSPNLYINAWAACGYSAAAEAAAFLGEEGGSGAAGFLDKAARWREEAAKMEAAMERVLLPHFGNERDLVVTPHPTGLARLASSIAKPFEAWYRKHRLDEKGARRPEKEWTYFEAAQIHNALLLGLKEEAWVNLDGMLEQDPAQAHHAFIEGSAGGNEAAPFANQPDRKWGWLQPGRAAAGNMPHNWTSAEMTALLRTLFVKEEGGGLVLGLGVPEAWMKPGSRFGVRNLPTDFGPVSYTAATGSDGKVTLEYEGRAPYRVAWEYATRDGRA